MKRRLTLCLAASLGACAGAPLATSFSVSSPTPAPDVLACARQQIKAVGFSQESYDESELRVTARKNDDKARRPDVQFRRMIDRVAVDVGPGGGDTVTTVAVQASTFAEYSTHRGPTEQQEKTSETAKQAAQTILDHCAAPR